MGNIKTKIIEAFNNGNFSYIMLNKDKALELYPDDEDIICCIVYTLIDPEYFHYQEAIELLNEKIQNKIRTNRIYYLLALCYDFIEENELSFKTIKKAISCNPKDHYSYTLLSNILQKNPKYSDNINNPISALKKAIELGGIWSDYFTLGVILWKKTNLLEAKKMLEIAINEIKGNPRHIREYEVLLLYIASIEKNESWDEYLNQRGNSGEIHDK